jgi:hypothetical protein
MIITEKERKKKKEKGRKRRKQERWARKDKRQKDKLTQCNCLLQPKNFTPCNFEATGHQSVRINWCYPEFVSQFAKGQTCAEFYGRSSSFNSEDCSS